MWRLSFTALALVGLFVHAKCVFEVISHVKGTVVVEMTEPSMPSLVVACAVVDVALAGLLLVFVCTQAVAVAHAGVGDVVDVALAVLVLAILPEAGPLGAIAFWCLKKTMWLA